MGKDDLIEIMIKEDGIWLHFIDVNVLISVESIARKSGPLVRKGLMEWMKKARENDND